MGSISGRVPKYAHIVHVMSTDQQKLDIIAAGTLAGAHSIVHNTTGLGSVDLSLPIIGFTRNIKDLNRLLDNMTFTPFFFKGLFYPCSEFTFQFGKCDLFGHGALFDTLRASMDFLSSVDFEKDATLKKFCMDSKKVGQTRFTGYSEEKWSSGKLPLMVAILSAKFSQHKESHDKLMATGNAYIYEISHEDNEWATGPQGEGKNLLGLALMTVRHLLVSGELTFTGYGANAQLLVAREATVAQNVAAKEAREAAAKQAVADAAAAKDRVVKIEKRVAELAWGLTDGGKREFLTGLNKESGALKKDLAVLEKKKVQPEEEKSKIESIEEMKAKVATLGKQIEDTKAALEVEKVAILAEKTEELTLKATGLVDTEIEAANKKAAAAPPKGKKGGK